jgi:hypothetical protein
MWGTRQHNGFDSTLEGCDEPIFRCAMSTSRKLLHKVCIIVSLRAGDSR